MSFSAHHRGVISHRRYTRTLFAPCADDASAGCRAIMLSTSTICRRSCIRDACTVTKTPSNMQLPTPSPIPSSAPRVPLAGETRTRARFSGMPDPRFRISAQDLTYAAHALRAEARRAEGQAADPQFECCRELFRSTSCAYDDLAHKFDQIAASIARQPPTSRSSR